MLKRETYVEYIKNEMSIFRNKILLETALNHNNLKLYGENFFRDILNIINDECDFKNTNILQSNFPSIDLVCDRTHQCIQITSDRSSEKIKHTLEKFSKLPEYKEYTLYIYYLLEIAKPKNIKQLEKDFNTSGLSSRLKDSSDLICEINDLSENKLEKIYNLFVKPDTTYLEDLDISKDAEFQKIYNFNSISVNQIFIEPVYKLYKNDDDTKKEIDKQSNNIIELVTNLLENNQVLFLIGTYGSGKTLLTKKIFFDLQGQYEICFIRAFDMFCKYRNEIDNKLFNLRTTNYDENKKFIIIIDGLDELNIGEESIRIFLNKTLSLIKQKQNIKMIFSTRLHIDFNESVFDNFYYIYGYIIDPNFVKFIELSHFTRKKISEWLTKYNDLMKEMNKYNSVSHLSLDDITNQNKLLFTSAQVPLFLFLLASSFYEDRYKNNCENATNIYKHFIDSTVRGKFQRTHNAIVNGPLYRDFLIKIACKMFKDGYEKDIISIDRNQNDVEKKYSLVNDLVIKIVSKSKNKIGIIENATTYANSMNCYFFEKYNMYHWRFTDDNIMFYLISEKYLTILLKINYIKTTKKLLKILKDYSFELYLDPVIFDFLKESINNFKSEEINEIQNYIDYMIEHQIILSSNETDDIQQYNVDYFFAIVYMCLNTKKKHFNHCYHTISNSLEKHIAIDKNYGYIFIRSFYGVSINDIIIEKQNLSGYNMSYSNLKNVTFQECRIHVNNTIYREAIVNNIIWENIKFQDSKIEKLKIENAKNTIISFDNCVIGELNFAICENSTFLFFNCKIQHIIFQNMKKLILKYDSCEVNTTIMNDLPKWSKVTIDKCSFSKIKFTNSCIILDMLDKKYDYEKQNSMLRVLL